MPFASKRRCHTGPQQDIHRKGTHPGGSRAEGSTTLPIPPWGRGGKVAYPASHMTPKPQTTYHMPQAKNNFWPLKRSKTFAHQTQNKYDIQRTMYRCRNVWHEDTVPKGR